MGPIEELRKCLDRAGHPEDPIKCLWEDVEVGHDSKLACYVANGRLFIVQTWITLGGWDIYVPASTSNDVGITLDATVDYLTSP